MKFLVSLIAILSLNACASKSTTSDTELQPAAVSEMNAVNSTELSDEITTMDSTIAAEEAAPKKAVKSAKKIKPSGSTTKQVKKNSKAKKTKTK